MTDPNNAQPANPPPPRPGRKGLTFALIGGAVALVLLAVALKLKHPAASNEPGSAQNGPSGPGQGSDVEGLPEVAASELEAPSEAAEPSVQLDVWQPAKLRAALAENGWLKENLDEPLGRGFLGSWAGFLLSKGEDLKAEFSGTVLGFLADQLLITPFSSIWFKSRVATGAPALVMPSPSAKTRSAYLLFDKLARRGSIKVKTCPGGAPLPKRGDEIGRWLVGDHPLYAVLAEDRLVLGKTPITVIYGLCADTKRLAGGGGGAPKDRDLEVVLEPKGIGREAELLSSLLGLSPDQAPRLGFAVDKDRLVPRGIAAELAVGGRLGKEPLAEALLKAVPEEIPVMLSLELRLPAELSAESLKSGLEGSGSLEPRQLVLLWNPRGIEAPTEVALIWSKAADQAALKTIFSGPNSFSSSNVCGNVVLSSSKELLAKIERSCSGASPSLLNAAPEVVAGWKKPSSVLVGIHLGHLLSQLTLDAYRAESARPAERISKKRGAPPPKPSPATPPPELQRALHALEALPFLGFSGSVENKTLVPGGFRS